MSDTIRFLANGELIEVEKGTALSETVLNYLRQNLHLTGTKEGCAEGDCGACTIVLGELIDNKLQMRSINACIQLLPTLHGKAIFTVEYLRQTDKTLHPVQQAMVENHGSQCGFCTPGFVMSLWDVYLQHQPANTKPDKAELRNALSGNLCRCTGYRPILDAGQAMMDHPTAVFDSTQIEVGLRAINTDSSAHFKTANEHFYAPKTLDTLCDLRAENPTATLLAGSTDIGLWVNKQFKALGDVIYLGEVKELRQCTEDDHSINIGAMVSLNDAFTIIAAHYPQIKQQWVRFASNPIRNAGTLGGNIANGSPIGDSMPWLIALGTQINLSNQQASRTLALEDFYLDYMQTDLAQDEIVEQIIVPKPDQAQHFRTYKLSRRYDSDISAISAGFSLKLEGDIVTDIKIAFGGVAAIPKRARAAEQQLLGIRWNESAIHKAMAILVSEFTPLSDMRASAENRVQSMQNLLYRFYLETQPGKPMLAEQISVFAE